MSDLTDFLLARIAEDEERVTAWVDGGALWPHEDHDFGECDECDDRRQHRAADDQIAARVLAECQVKRRIVELHRPSDERNRWCSYCAGTDHAEYPCETSRVLALPYTEHPDFNPAWRLAGEN